MMRKPSTRGILSSCVVILVSVPLVFVIYSSLQLSQTQWLGLWSERLPGLLWNTLSLAVCVGLGCLLLGVSTAWLVVRRRFVGQHIAVWLMILPLTIPTYVFAYIYTNLFEQDGWLGQLWTIIFSNSLPLDIYNLAGATVVLTLAGFSYVFLLVRDALSRTPPGLEEAARIQGASPLQIFWRINMPMLRPAIAAGITLVTLHVLSDFGAVSILHYRTFTLSIFLQMNGRFDFNAAAGLSLVLVSLSLTFLILERFFRSRQRYYTNSPTHCAKVRQASVVEQISIWLWLGVVTLFAFILPLAWMIAWSWEAWLQDLIDSTFAGYMLNSVLVAIFAATFAMIVALPVALYHARQRSLLSQMHIHFSSIGFVLPGPVIALGLLAFVMNITPMLYGGFAALILAMLLRFLPLAVQAQEAAVQQLTPSIEQAGRNLGAGSLENLWRVVLPVIRGGMLSAWVLVFIDTLKELPATLILRPTGFDTLPVRIWIEASEEMLELAAPAALMLVIATVPILWFFVRPKPQI